MKESLFTLTKLLAEDKKFSKEFSSLKSVDEQYDFAQKRVTGYTKKEFENFLSELEKAYKKNEVSLELLENVSGGINKHITAAAMAMLTLMTTGEISNFTAMESPNAVHTEDSKKILDFNRLFDQKDLSAAQDERSSFDYWNSSDSGDLRKQIYQKLTDPDQKKADNFVFQVRCYYDSLNANTYKWVRSPGWIWTGWKFEYTEEQKNLAEEFTKASEPELANSATIMLWLNKKFEDGYYLYYFNGNLYLRKSTLLTAKVLNYDLFTEEHPGTTITKDDFDYVLQDMEAMLNQARAFRGACEEAGKTDLANTVMKTQ